MRALSYGRRVVEGVAGECLRSWPEGGWGAPGQCLVGCIRRGLGALEGGDLKGLSGVRWIQAAAVLWRQSKILTWAKISLKWRCSMVDGWPDGDTRHVFLATARNNSRCHLCLKPKDHVDHIDESTYAQLQQSYATAQTPEGSKRESP